MYKRLKEVIILESKKPTIVKVLQVFAIIIIAGGIIGSLLLSQPPAGANTNTLDPIIFLSGSLISIFTGIVLLGLKEIIVLLFNTQKKLFNEKVS